MKATQTAYFKSTETMNKWLRDNAVIPKDIKMSSTQYSMHYLVIFDKEFKEKVVYE